MARTKQTARKSTGGMAPRKQLATKKTAVRVLGDQSVGASVSIDGMSDKHTKQLALVAALKSAAAISSFSSNGKATNKLGTNGCSCVCSCGAASSSTKPDDSPVANSPLHGSSSEAEIFTIDSEDSDSEEENGDAKDPIAYEENPSEEKLEEDQEPASPVL